MSTTIMRELKDGSGFSPCSASEENVGKRRCNHAQTISFNVQVNKIGPRIKEVIVSDDYDKLDKRDRKEVISSFISTLEPISQETADNILSQLRDM